MKLKVLNGVLEILVSQNTGERESLLEVPVHPQMNTLPTFQHLNLLVDEYQ